ncbi:hypothetical protein ACFXKC_56585 [Streptomyces sp. NPDC059340]|uniref:hypothetical protein n=1 Tax=Streptomyces sp. NPDC059340 TaxID=3346806 RepID=UPI0036C67E3B
MRMQLTDEKREFIGSYLPIGEYGPFPERLREQFEGVIWRFETGWQWLKAWEASPAGTTRPRRATSQASTSALR